jgi:hypothetical protein
MLKKNRLFVFSIAMALILIGAKYFWVQDSQPEHVGHHAASAASGCLLSTKPCSLEGLGQLSTPSVLAQEQPFEVYFSPSLQSEVPPELTFNMKAMDMGRNHYTQWVMTVKDNKKTADMLLEFPK